MVDGLSRLSSYFGFIAPTDGTIGKKIVDGVASCAQRFLSFIVAPKAPEQEFPFSYCIYPAGFSQAAKIMCKTTDVALNEFNLLLANCSATSAPDQACAVTLKNAQPYGQCGNSAYCNLLYNGPINACFNKTLNATVPSCLSEPTTAPAAPLDGRPLSAGAIVGITLASIGLFTTGLVLIVRYNKKIAEIFSKCACCRHLDYKPLVSRPLDKPQGHDADTL